MNFSKKSALKILAVIGFVIISASVNVFAQNIQVLFPNGGETIFVETNEYIVWSSVSGINDVNIEFSTDNGVRWTTIASVLPNSGLFSWKVPQISSTQCLIRISNAENLADNDVSDMLFSIIPNISPKIYGDIRVGFGGEVAYYTNVLSEGTYVWSANGGTINSGQGTRSVKVSWSEGVTQGTLTLSGNSLQGQYNTHQTVSISTALREIPISVDGSVRALATDKNTVYIGGDFTQILPKRNFGTNGVVVSTRTGETAEFFPKVNGTVFSAIPDGAGGWIIGGSFTLVGNQPRRNLARINADGTVHSWNPSANYWVYALALYDNILYVGGEFTQIGEKQRNYLAAIEMSSGLPTSWNPKVSGSVVFALAVAYNAVYIGGNFTSVGGLSRRNIAAVAVGSGEVSAWNPEANSYVKALCIKGTILYVGGNFTWIGNKARSRVAAVNIGTGLSLDWAPDVNGTVYSLALRGNSVCIGGDFTSINSTERHNIAEVQMYSGVLMNLNLGTNGIVHTLALENDRYLKAGGEFTTIGDSERKYLAEIDLQTKSIGAWNPSANYDVRALAISGNTMYIGGYFTGIGGEPRKHLAAIDAKTGTLMSWNPVANHEILSLSVSGNIVYAGGYFTEIGGESRKYLAAIDALTGLATSWNPRANSWVLSLAVRENTIFAGGYFTEIGGSERNYIAAVDATTGLATQWNPHANYYVKSLSLGSHVVNVGGDFTSIADSKGSSVASIDENSGLAVQWNSAYTAINAISSAENTVFAAGNYGLIVAIDAYSGVKKWDAEAWSNRNTAISYALCVNDHILYCGGLLRKIGTDERLNLAAVEAESGALIHWNPEVNSTVYAIAARDREVLAGGAFTGVDGVETGGFAMMRTPTRTSGISEISDTQKESKVRVFPNPVNADTDITIETTDNETGVAELAVSDALGNTVMQTSFPVRSGKNILRLPTDGLTNGMYTGNLKNGRNLQVFRFIIVR